MYAKKRWSLILFLVSIIFLVSCAKESLPPAALSPSETSPAQVAPAAPSKEASPTKAVSQPPAFESEALEAKALPPEKRLALYGRSTPPLEAIFFNFDSYEIRDDMKARLQKDARILLEHPNWKIQLQGNCDERGSSEYNLALGEKRALMVKRYLMNLGIEARRLTTVSFGEERPLAKGHNEKAWALNRRVDLVVVNK